MSIKKTQTPVLLLGTREGKGRGICSRIEQDHWFGHRRDRGLMGPIFLSCRPHQSHVEANGRCLHAGHDRKPRMCWPTHIFNFYDKDLNFMYILFLNCFHFNEKYFSFVLYELVFFFLNFTYNYFLDFGIQDRQI